MKNLFNKVREFMFRGTNGRLSVAYRTYMMVLILSIMTLVGQNSAFQYNGSKVMMIFYIIVFIVVPFILLIATFLKVISKVKNRRGR